MSVTWYFKLLSFAKVGNMIPFSYSLLKIHSIQLNIWQKIKEDLRSPGPLWIPSSLLNGQPWLNKVTCLLTWCTFHIINKQVRTSWNWSYYQIVMSSHRIVHSFLLPSLVLAINPRQTNTQWYRLIQLWSVLTRIIEGRDHYWPKLHATLVGELSQRVMKLIG